MENVGYYNGKIAPIDELTVPVNDRAVCFGDGIYDAAVCRNAVPYRLDEHIGRFYQNCARLRIEGLPEPENLTDVLHDLVNKVGMGESFLYFQASRGTAPRDHAFPDRATANLLVTVRKQPFADMKKRIALCTTPDRRYRMCDMKTLNLLPAVLAAQEAKEKGCTEAVFHRAGTVTECSHSNVSILKNGVLYTHPADSDILPGVARADLIHVCGDLGIPVVEEPFSIQEMAAADEILVTSSSKFCLAADRLDGVPVGGRDNTLLGKIQKSIEDAFAEATEKSTK